MSEAKAAQEARNCGRCGGTDLFGPGPMRTSAHPNSSFLLLETPGAHFHDITVEGRVCLDCGAVGLELSPATLRSLRREIGRDGPAGRAR